MADGAMRDALSILDQCSSFYLGQRITLEKVYDVLGAVDTQIFYEATRALAAGMPWPVYSVWWKFLAKAGIHPNF